MIGVFGVMWCWPLVSSVYFSVFAPPSGADGTSVMFGPIASATVINSSARTIGSSTVIGWVKSIPVPNLDVAVGVPNVGSAADTAGARPARSPSVATTGNRRRTTDALTSPTPALPSGRSRGRSGLPRAARRA